MVCIPHRSEMVLALGCSEIHQNKFSDTDSLYNTLKRCKVYFSNVYNTNLCFLECSGEGVVCGAVPLYVLLVGWVTAGGP